MSDMPAKNARYFKSDLTVMNLADEMADIASKIESICEALVVDKNVEVTLSGSILAEATVLNVTTAGTRVLLPDILCHEVTIIAKRPNTGYINAGKNTVSSTVYGVEFAAKDSFTFNVSNANQIYIDASISGEGICYVAI